ncbi:MAG: FAD-dependent oxidoreductase, partial [Pararheinheimera sp.]|nr:FAD-dependent oxidoreductase [Rheinheimera sp.]
MTNPDHKQINNKGLSRREALLWIGKVGGSAAMLQAAGLFGLLTTAPVVAQPELVKLKPLTTGRKSVLILGAGISGLVAAYELGKAGYQCKILEASHRAGGRNFTIRHGDFIDELGNPQFCNFDKDPDLYFNAGPARIPAHHTAILHYCREFAVEMQMFCNYNKNCYTQDDNAFAGKPVRIREYEADTRGFFSELMAKSIQAQAKLDAPFDDIDKQKLIEFCRAYGDLSSDFTYEGSERAGYQSGGILSPGVLKKPKAFADLLQSNFWAGAMHFGEISDQSAALMTPVGGMDKIVDAFLSRLAGKVQLKAQVQKVQLLPQGVEVSYWLDGQL